MRIGEIAAEAGVNTQTLRYYERRGLLSAPPRNACGHRIYSDETVRLVRFIKRMQTLGFSLLDIEDLLNLGNEVYPRVVERMVRQMQEDVRARMRDLQAIDAALSRLMADAGDELTDAETLLLGALGERAEQAL